MSFLERIKQIFDAIAYFGGLAVGVSLIALFVFILIYWLGEGKQYPYFDDEEFDERIG